VTKPKSNRAKRDSTNGTGPSQPDGAADWQWADPNTLMVNPVFQRLIPKQSKGERQGLEASIRVDGCLDPLVIWKGHNIVLDGHTRREFCILYHKQVKIRYIELANEEEAIAYILGLQQQRRNLTLVAMSYLRGTDYNAQKKQHGGDRRSGGSSEQFVPLIVPTQRKKTAQQLAEKYKVSHMSIKRDGGFAQDLDKVLKGHPDPDVQRNLLCPDVKLTHGTARWLLDMEPKERREAVDQLIERGAVPRAKKTKYASGPEGRAQSLLAGLRKKGEEHARDVVRAMARLVGLALVK